MPVTLTCINEQDKMDIPDEWMTMLQKLLHLAGESEEVNEGEVVLTFVDDDQIQELNRTYRNMDQPTDVLSFPLMDEGEEEIDISFSDMDEMPQEMLGDLVISLERAEAQSKEYGHSLEREVGFLFVHGFLHLLGYDHNDEEEEREMFSRQEDILQRAGLVR